MKAAFFCILQGFVPLNQNVYRGYFPVQPGNLSYKEGFEAGEQECDTTGNPLLEQTPFPNIKVFLRIYLKFNFTIKSNEFDR